MTAELISSTLTAFAAIAPSTELVQALRALGDETRLSALTLIATAPRSTTELAALLGIGQPGVSAHLRVLAQAGLVTRRRNGHFVLYGIRASEIESVWTALVGHLRGMASPRD
jgi:DNA-binding transcriptional ArsR family regulator